MKLKSKLLSLIMIALVSFPVPVIARQNQNQVRTVMIIPVGESNEKFADTKDYIQDSIKLAMTDRTRVIVKAVHAKDLMNFGNAESPTLTRAQIMYDSSLEDYNAYKATADETIAAMDNTQSFLRKNVPPSAKASHLMLSAVITKAWLMYQTDKKNEARPLIADLLEYAPVMETLLLYYPPDFRSFFNSVKKNTASSTYTLSVPADNEPMDISINHIFVGSAPLSIRLKPGEYMIGFYSHGKKPVTKNMTLNKDKDIKVELSGDVDTNNRSQAMIASWNTLSQAQKIAFASQLGDTGPDLILFFETNENNHAARPQVSVYDPAQQRTLKTITYPFAVEDFNNQKETIAQFFKKELPLLTMPQTDAYAGITDTAQPEPVNEIQKKKPLLKKPLFWIVSTLSVAALTGTAIALSRGSSSTSSNNGSVVVSLGGQ
ncbi:MAG: PEGA domain-containing protein [Deltaproteobacteria bacterium]|nr:PEGA domain-containing protein [Deltaproteobacteria bacterium]